MNDRISEYLESFGDDEIATWTIGSMNGGTDGATN